MLKIEWRPVGRFYEVKVVIKDGAKIEFPGLLNTDEIRELASDITDAAGDFSRFMEQSEQ